MSRPLARLPFAAARSLAPRAVPAALARGIARQQPAWHLSQSTVASSSSRWTRAASSSVTLSTGTAPSLPPIPSNPTIAVSPPDLNKIKEEGYLEDDVALVAPTEASLVITPDAIRQLALLASREPAGSPLALRVGVDSGGCHGYQYTMELTEQRGVDDYAFTVDGVAALPVLVDLMSLGLLKGATLHYATELIGSSFRLQDNPQAKDGGACGCGVSWEAK